MPLYTVRALNKKSTIEIETWAHEKDFNKSFTKELGWRSGSFKVRMLKDEMEEIPKDSEDNQFYPYSYDDSELIETWDGCWEDFNFSESTITEEEQAQIEGAWQEESYEGLENLGYQQVETDVILVGPLEFELDEDDEGDDEEESDVRIAPSDEGNNAFTTLAATLAAAKKDKN